MTRLVEPERIAVLHDAEPASAGRYVLYWMQAAQRAEHNPALEFAVPAALRRKGDLSGWLDENPITEPSQTHG